VERGRGVHNVNFAFALLTKAHEQMNQARRAKGLPALSRPWSEPAGGGECIACHVGIDAQEGTFAGRTFRHRPHFQSAKLACQECHRPHAERAPGEVVRFGATGCVPCHHRQKALEADVCKGCHGDVTQRTVTSYRGEFSHRAHLENGLECQTCHPVGGGDPKPARSTCEDCHADG